jgi:hypothetical protein
MDSPYPFPEILSELIPFDIIYATVDCALLSDKSKL